MGLGDILGFREHCVFGITDLVVGYCMLLLGWPLTSIAYVYTRGEEKDGQLSIKLWIVRYLLFEVDRNVLRLGLKVMAVHFGVVYKFLDMAVWYGRQPNSYGI